MLPTLRQLASKCHFDAVTQEKLLIDRILFGIHNNNVRERFRLVQSLS